MTWFTAATMTGMRNVTPAVTWRAHAAAAAAPSP
eukprot:CAMPEP_0175768844 /NCGR_PEP_ID=MMETSP0097-20121207/70646_1 /TAXON_ID=311494 /ORGANISM="Alexandrium monilatum, Strain CCMP3105" /LENGTH=33 /DNA_ID= /DNA_START= /DNA_END= /DNA_ORIENTATION=